MKVGASSYAVDDFRIRRDSYPIPIIIRKTIATRNSTRSKKKRIKKKIKITIHQLMT